MCNMTEWSVERLPKELSEKIEEIKDKHGFNSKSDFIAQAVRDLIERYEKPRFSHFNFQDNLIRLIDNHTPLSPFIEIYGKNHNLMCETCNSQTCIHIRASWQNPSISRELKRTGYKNLIRDL